MLSGERDAISHRDIEELSRVTVNGKQPYLHVEGNNCMFDRSSNEEYPHDREGDGAFEVLTLHFWPRHLII